MATWVRMSLIVCVITWCGAMMAGCTFSSRIELHNLTFRTLTPYPLRRTPPPPHRQANLRNNVLSGRVAPINPLGFNPVYFVPGVADEGRANGLYIGLDLYEADPMRIQYKVFHYRVRPGQAGTDPANQPILLQDEVVEVSDVDLTIEVRSDAELPGGWSVVLRPR